MQTRILVLDDEKEIADLVTLYLKMRDIRSTNFMTAKMHCVL